MNYLEQIQGFWKAHEVQQFDTKEIALYFYLLQVWNTTVWQPKFNRNNYKAMGDIGVECRHTLKKIKEGLQQAGVLQFEQKNGDANCLYIMKDLSKFYTGKLPGGDKLYNKSTGKVTGELPAQLPVKINENENGNNTLPSDALGGNPSGDGSEVEKQKSVTKFWAPLKTSWFDFYQKNFSRKPTFNGAAAKNFKFIVDQLEKLAVEKGKEWTEEYAVRCLVGFLDKAYLEEWLRKNFLLTNLATKFDSIVNSKQDGKTGSTHQQSAAGRTDKPGTSRARVDALKEWGLK